jgi:surface antigen
MNRRAKISGILLCITGILAYTVYKLILTCNPNPNFFVGQKLDSLNHVCVYYNGGISHTGKRNVSKSGYNLGLTYQCVEFVKRYYFEVYKHEMPDSYGNAKDFFDKELSDGALNKRRNLRQYKNFSSSKPQIGDLVVFDGHPGNSYGHVAIISHVTGTEIEIIQQNPGPFAASRARFALNNDHSLYSVQHERILGWLRMK